MAPLTPIKTRNSKWLNTEFKIIKSCQSVDFTRHNHYLRRQWRHNHKKLHGVANAYQVNTKTYYIQWRVITYDPPPECIILYNDLCTMHTGGTLHCKSWYKRHSFFIPNRRHWKMLHVMAWYWPGNRIISDAVIIYIYISDKAYLIKYIHSKNKECTYKSMAWN